MENQNPCNPRPTDCVLCPENTTDLDTEPYRGSFQRLLSVNTGRFVTIEFMLTTCELRAISGIVENATGRYVILRHPKTGVRTAADAWTIKTVTFPCCE